MIKHTLIKYTLTLALGVLLLSSCSTESTPTDAVSVVGNWELVSFNLNDGTTVPVDDPSAFTATFTAEGRLNVKADCNQCNTSYEVDGETLTTGPLACTRAFCGDDSLSDEYIAALDSATSFANSGSDLLISYDGGVLRFRPA